MTRLVFILVWAFSICVAVQLKRDCNCEVGCARNPRQIQACQSCKVGWYGPYCQKKNVALNRPSSHQGIHGLAEAHLAVDGNTHTDLKNGSCSHTKKRNMAISWWSVQLGDNGVNQIRYMKIFNPETPFYAWKRRGMEILIDGKRCKKWPDDKIPETIEDVTCTETLTGHNLTITVVEQYFSVCEVQVFVCSDGWFGEDCDKQCKCLNSTEVCDKVTGRCQRGCQAGYIGNDCQTLCSDGWFGEVCAKQCKCHHSNGVCDKMTGRCTRGCQAGYMGDDCQTLCRDGRYGQDCSKECGHCANNQSCYKTDGHCPGACGDGWGWNQCDVVILAAVVTGLVVLLSVAGILLCLIRQQRLQWVKKSTKKEAQVRRESIEIDPTEQQPADDTRHVNSSDNVQSNFVVQDTAMMATDDDNYEAVELKLYQNI